ncbi:helix-turn-helix domain-containing protein [Microbacterium suwonense]|uniref:HTH cro/C1-type domain-containing protein n=1 Tax=Microbacterium suwonense TaxID=683047 RepID=A0ABN6X589_9MICO|nr:helix-turn-helix domain-containing protein [Microbacterium suwonense]BDZ39866.1 hypothetical protein GCM10025863_24800 [Microbacterium suwonense]
MDVRLVNTTDLGAVAAEQRIKIGLTQSELAQRADVTRDWLARFETGSPNVTIARVMRVYRVLGLDLVVRDEAA